MTKWRAFGRVYFPALGWPTVGILRQCRNCEAHDTSSTQIAQNHGADEAGETSKTSRSRSIWGTMGR